MKIKILLPTKILLEEPATKINAEAENGAFGILPNHIDFVTALVPSILSFVTPQGQENFLAVDQGILVKCGNQVLISTRQAIRGNNLETLQQTVETEFKKLNEKQKMARSAAAKLEISFMRGLVKVGSANSEAPT
ncbi:F0F1 ATP synthase subunit epsilon [Anabaenopsis arnoldii]|uniref:F0F1 ATP synthase subunit epsilon n=1 Tax=Anabaenopsis arnoldii TaxID=2152938 RepID=A0ABT5AQM1_9CYAN|nr:F0F1 ATP synthase subunit epsilon [Anabaenopsis arnoldii]MDB9539611.1 F0F1 ATP synthase subunit epsilon [Anabaenopsis arnoldii]MDH6091916.1 F0F1 ATP synthase subunit epsilon [Anabaenopsis arnoldii]